MRSRLFIVCTAVFFVTLALVFTTGPSRPARQVAAHSTSTLSPATSSSSKQGTKRHKPNPLPSPSPSPTPTPTATSSPTPTPTLSPTPSPSTSPIPSPGCTGSALTSQSQVTANTSYCGGHATSRIVLANGDTWTAGEVSGVTTGSQQGAVQCGNPCTLVNVYIHDNPLAFAGIYAPSSGSGPMLVSGGRVTGSGSLGIGGSGVSQLTISGVEIDHNGASASCGFEGGGFKGVNSGSRFTGNYVHDNNCMGVWYDINAANNQIDHNRVDNNSHGGIFYEISQDASIHDNEVSGNGKSACSWLWGAGIGVASSFNVNVYNNTLTNNCNGVGETQQNRTDSTPPAHLLQNVSVSGNTINGSGRTGAVADNGTVLSTRNLTWSVNIFGTLAVFCGLTC
jgi:parallel beta-helix repeat protein